ncbi:MAG: hypothetical protein EDQ89_04645 [Acidobacteria bacterium]|nr:MAG: hypothetical protein EDQ89_04645 [Acidobacteriota bacterium]MCL4287109.1 hypothetical protein [Thermoleophilia bacterium]GIK78244.1 MAG: hypothetical protein BroJett022_19340 [Actinomycetes bacterium]
MSRIGWPLAAVIAALVIAVAILAGALIAGGDGDDEDGPEIATVTVPAQPAGVTGGAEGAATAPQGVGPADADPDDRPLGSAEAGRAGRAAIAAVGGGTVVEVDRSDDPGEAYEVEVLTDRGEIDVALDHNLRRVPNAAYEDSYGD